MTVQTAHRPYHLGLALSGGGAKGFAHLGVFKALEECGLRPDLISGTSAGALMGVLYADGYSAEKSVSCFLVVSFLSSLSCSYPRRVCLTVNVFAISYDAICIQRTLRICQSRW